MLKTFILLVALTFSIPCYAQVQFSNISSANSSGDKSGYSIIVDGKNTELLICEGPCTRMLIRNYKEDVTGFSFSIFYWGELIQYRAVYDRNILRLKTLLPHHGPGPMTKCVNTICPNHRGFKLVF